MTIKTALLCLGLSLSSFPFARAQTSTSSAAPAPVAAATSAAPVKPPTAQAYVAVEPRVQTSFGQTMVPIRFFADALGASVGPMALSSGQNLWRITYFGQTADLYPYQNGARLNERSVSLLAQPMTFGGTLYVPFPELAEFFGIKWKLLKNSASRDVMLLQYPAAFIQNVRHANTGDKVRVVMELSNPTRVVAAQNKLDVQFLLAAARRANVATVTPVNDYLVPRVVTRTGNWQGTVSVRLNYQAPVRWFTMGNPPRLVIDLQRLFEESSQSSLGGGLTLSRIRRGTLHGPVQMFLIRVDPREGWRVRPEPAGFSSLQRTRVSTMARRAKSLVAVNGGFFAYDGAAVGAVMRAGEWIRLPWKGRTALGFLPDGSARIGNLQTHARAEFSGGQNIPVRDLNGWPDRNGVTALTRRFRSYYKLRAGEIAVVVTNGVVSAKPGSGGVAVPANGFVLVAGGGAVPVLNQVSRGMKVNLKVQPIGWPTLLGALGGGPRLVNNGQVHVTALREDFRSDVRVGLGPRTAFGIDREGRFLILVADGRQKYYSTGLTLTELAQTLRKFGAVDALNFDGGGSTAMVVRGKVINRPSDGRERAVANALIVTR
ncbi:MAG TPA: phosphodiester glycosidase family protein [Abditibacteriaceae bacterium]|jgi:hypothetical protein